MRSVRAAKGSALPIGRALQFSPRAIQKPPRQQIAQVRCAGAEKRKRRDRYAEFEREWKRRLCGAEGTHHLDESRQ